MDTFGAFLELKNFDLSLVQFHEAQTRYTKNTIYQRYLPNELFNMLMPVKKMYKQSLKTLNLRFLASSGLQITMVPRTNIN